MNRLINAILSLILPDACVGCRTRGGLLCSTCEKTLAPASSSSDVRIISVFSYADSRVRRLVWLLKYRSAKRVAESLGKHMAAALVEHLGEESHFSGKVILVPVPVTSRRKRSRGFNQSEALALAIVLHVPGIEISTRLLSKTRDTKAQAETQSRAERVTNLGDCFKATRDDSLLGRTIVLVDDVTTTGATFIAAKNALTRAGYRRVIMIAACH